MYSFKKDAKVFITYLLMWWWYYYYLCCPCQMSGIQIWDCREERRFHWRWERFEVVPLVSTRGHHSLSLPPCTNVQPWHLNYNTHHDPHVIDSCQWDDGRPAPLCLRRGVHTLKSYPSWLALWGSSLLLRSHTHTHTHTGHPFCVFIDIKIHL